MRLELALDHYLNALKVERGLANNTVAGYGRDLSKLVRFAEDRGVIATAGLDLGLVTAWLAQLTAHGLGTRSAARHLSALRGWCRFLVAEGHLSTDPSRLVGRPRLGRRLPRPLEVDTVWRLLQQPNPASPRGLRDLAMLSLAYAAGLRVSELLGLTLADLDRSRGVVSAYGKGGKRRLVPIGELCLNHVDAYLRARATRPAPNRSGLLFTSARGKPFSRQMFWKLVKRYAYQAGLAGDIHPHRLRHSFATHLLAGGADLRSVQTLLGHADVSTTEVYTHVSQSQIQAAHRVSHPRG